MHILCSYIQYAKIAKYFQQDITIDFIIRLPRTKNITTEIKYNNILIVVDKLIKYIHLVLYKKHLQHDKQSKIYLIEQYDIIRSQKQL